MSRRRKTSSVEDVFNHNTELMKRLSIESPEELVTALGDLYDKAKRDKIFGGLIDYRDKAFLIEYYYRNCNAGIDRFPACLKVFVNYLHTGWENNDGICSCAAVIDRIENKIKYEYTTVYNTEVIIEQNLSDIEDEIGGNLEKRIFCNAETARWSAADCGSEKKRKMDDELTVRCEFADGLVCESDSGQPYETLFSESRDLLNYIRKNMA